MEPDRSSFVANEFLNRFISDRAVGLTLDLDDYLRLFPGHEEAVKREYEELHAAGPGRSAAQRESIGLYLIEGVLGRGGQAVVWRGRDPRSGRRVAIKTIRCRAGFDFGQALLRLRREARALGELDHPGICPILEFGRHESDLFIVMPLLEGRPLTEALRADRFSSPRERRERAIAWILDVADALQHAHVRGIVHRDVKPSNIMVVGDRAVLLDFGVARWSDGSATTLTDEGDLVGTPAYLAPEIVASETASPRSDVYALGVTLFWGLTGERPFEAPDRASLLNAIARGDFDREPLRRARVGSDLAAVVASALQPHPYDRYESAAELRGDLRRIQRGEPPHVVRKRLLRTLWRSARKNVAATILVSLLVSSAIAATGFGAYLLRGRDAYRKAEETRLRIELDRRLTRAYTLLWEGHRDRARAVFQSLDGRADPVALAHRAEIGLGLHALDPRRERPPEIDDSPALRAFANVNQFLVASRSSREEAGGAMAAREVEVAAFNTPVPRLLFDVARIFVARSRSDPAEARRAAEGLVNRWPDHPSTGHWRAMAYESASLDESLRLYGDRRWGPSSAERMLLSLPEATPGVAQALVRRLRELARSAPPEERARWPAILARIPEDR